MSIASKKDIELIEKPIVAVMRQGARLQALFVLALPGVVGVLLLYGAYDSLRMHHTQNAAVVAALAALFFCPLVLAVLSELHRRRFIL
jgi:hypothetical protein